MEDYQWGGWSGERLQGIRSINGRWKIDRGRLRIVSEMYKPNNLYVRSMARTKGGLLEGIGVLVGGGQRGKIGTIVIA